MSSMPTLANTPRDEAALSECKVFVHRRVGELLEEAGFPLWKTEREKAAFLTSSPAERAKAILVRLREYDAASGGAPAPMALPVAAAVVAAAVVEEAPAPAKRAPRTTVSAAPVAAPAGTTAGVQELLLAIKSLGDQMSVLSGKVEAMERTQAGLVKSVGINESALNDVKASLAASMKIQQVMLGLHCLFGQQVLETPMEAFLPAAISDANTALDQIEALGKD